MTGFLDRLDNDVFHGVIRESGIDPRSLKRARLREQWEDIAGEDLARHLSIHSFRDNRLVLKATDPSWSHEASMIKDQLISTINRHFQEQLVKTINIIQ